MNREDAIKVLKSLVECLSIDCDDDCEHCHIQLDGITAVLEACAVAITELSQIDTDTVSRQRAINANHLRRWILSRVFKTQLSVADVIDQIDREDTIEPEPTEQQVTCEYCHEDAEGYVRPVEKNNHAFVRFGMNGWELSLKGNGWHGEAPIHFCPMCGRKLMRRSIDNDNNNNSMHHFPPSGGKTGS